MEKAALRLGRALLEASAGCPGQVRSREPRFTRDPFLLAAGQVVSRAGAGLPLSGSAEGRGCVFRADDPFRVFRGSCKLSVPLGNLCVFAVRKCDFPVSTALP